MGYHFPMKIGKITHLALLAGFGWAAISCQSTGGGEPARDVAVKVYPSDLAQDVRQLWAIDAQTGEKLDPLIEGTSLSYKARFSPSKAWLAVEDKVTDSFTTVRLFHQSAMGGFRCIPDEQFMPALWERFRREQSISGEGAQSSTVSVDGWSRDESSLDLSVSVVLPDGRTVTGTVPVELDRLK